MTTSPFHSSRSDTEDSKQLIQEALSTDYSDGIKLTDKKKLRAFKQLPETVVDTELSFAFLRSFHDLDYTLRNIDSYYESKKGKLFKELINTLPETQLKHFIYESSSSDITAYIVEKLRHDQNWLKEMYYSHPRIAEHAKWYITDVEEVLDYHHKANEVSKIVELDDMIDAVGDNLQYKLTSKFAFEFYPFVIDHMDQLRSLPELVLCYIEDEIILYETYLMPQLQHKTELKLIIISKLTSRNQLSKLLLFEDNEVIRRIIRKYMRKKFLP